MAHAMAAVIERPARAPETEEVPEAPGTQPQPQRGKRWWQRMTPWPRGRTRNAAPPDDDRLVIENKTDAVWSLHVGYRALEPVPPRSKRQEQVVKTGMLTARILNAPVGTEYLTAYLNPHVRAVQIRGKGFGGQQFYELRIVP